MEPEKKPLRDPKLFETNHKHQNILLEGEGDNLTIPSYKCPICGESSIALAQLNRHIDDLHNLGSESYSDNSTADAKRNTDSERARNRSGAILEAEKQIVGVENWQPDEEVSHCKLCFAKFGLLTRKHHCRLCGSVVDDGSFTENTPARLCSAQVPLSLLMEKLPQLNYSPIVKSNWDILISAGGVEASHSRDFSVRVCKTCKDSLLHSKHDSRVDLPENIDVLSAYDEILAVKATIISSLARYQNLIQENKEAYNNQVNRLRSRLRKAVKDLEIMVNAFLNRFFAIDAQSKRLTPTHSAKLVTNIYKASSVFLQDSILQFKRLNEEFQKVEHQKLAGQLGASTRAESCTQHSSPLSATMSLNISSRLTKKQIRELREQLMVTNEQKFIIESLIEDVKRQRKFDELTTLEGNRKELACRIAELTDELGEYGF
ncbi:hypothetical protein OXX59_008773 [Metschnikowia pulcherrima]